jgi:hypothetical protein
LVEDRVDGFTGPEKFENSLHGYPFSANRRFAVANIFVDRDSVGNRFHSFTANYAAACSVLLYTVSRSAASNPARSIISMISCLDQFYFAAGFDRVAVGEFTAIGLTKSR